MSTHEHDNSMVIDDDSALFTIHPITRAITYNSTDPLCMIQDDRNSERLTFEIPKIIEGHNMLECDLVEIHYINLGANGSGQNEDIYRVSDLSEYEPNSDGVDMLRFTWLVSSNATKYAGKTIFAVRFSCTDGTDEGKILYEWATYPCDVITVGESIRNTKSIDETIIQDILAGWEERLMIDHEWIPNEKDGDNTILRIKSLYGGTSTSDDLRGPSNYQVWLDSGNTGTEEEFFATLKGEKGDKGDKGDNGQDGATPDIQIGTVQTVGPDNPIPKVEVTGEKDKPTLNFTLPEPARDYITDIEGNQMYFFTGSKEEYDALTEEQKANIFALITDDETETETGNDSKLYEFRTSYITDQNVRFHALTVYDSGTGLFTGSSSYYDDRAIVKINDVLIPEDGKEVIVEQEDYSDTFGLEAGTAIVTRTAKYICNTSSEYAGKTLLTTRLLVGPWWSSSPEESIVISTRIFVDGVICTEKRAFNNTSKSVFGDDGSEHIEDLVNYIADIYGTQLYKGDYILDANNNLFQVYKHSTSEDATILFLNIRSNFETKLRSLFTIDLSRSCTGGATVYDSETDPYIYESDIGVTLSQEEDGTVFHDSEYILESITVNDKALTDCAVLYAEILNNGEPTAVYASHTEYKVCIRFQGTGGLVTGTDGSISVIIPLSSAKFIPKKIL